MQSAADVASLTAVSIRMRGRGLQLQDPGHQVDPVGARQVHVEEDARDLLSLQDREGLLARRGDRDLEALMDQVFPDGVADGLFVVHDEEASLDRPLGPRGLLHQAVGPDGAPRLKGSGRSGCFRVPGR